MNLTITYRGPLASCDYSCEYCPFAKRHDDRAAREKDRGALFRFVNWVKSRRDTDSLRILFTPWGEALIRRWYREAIVQLSQLPHVEKVVIQTNLSTPVGWLADSVAAKVALWTTFHPGQTGLRAFVEKTRELGELGIAHSVGIVGKKAHKGAARALRAALAAETYLWVNAYKDEANYYQPEDMKFFRQIDPLFDLNHTNHPSLGEACNAGEVAISVDGEGTVYPCHFVKRPLGNLYTRELHEMLAPYRCPNTRCGCYIGYIHLKALRAADIYGDRILERIPVSED